MSVYSTLAKHNGPLAYRINDAVAASGLGRSNLYNMMRDGRLPFIEVGKIRMIRADDLRKLLKIEERDDA
jgi:hypothetical protein